MIDIEKHLKITLYELETIKREYIENKNRQKADTMDRAIKIIIKAHPDLMEKWYIESMKTPPPIIETEPIETKVLESEPIENSG